MSTAKELTCREKQVAFAIIIGQSVKDVAEELSISKFTVMRHKQAIYEKLNVRNTAELSFWWFCKNYNLNVNIQEIKRNGGVVICLFLFLISSINIDDDIARRTRRGRRGRRNEIECIE